MPITVDWSTKVILVPRADLTFLGGSLYEFDVDVFRSGLKALEASEVGITFPDTHRHVTEIVLSGVTYARFVEIINGYTVTFEAVGSPYRVKAVGANHNVSDVQNLNDVSLIIGNAAGLVVVGAEAVDHYVVDQGWVNDSAIESWRATVMLHKNGQFVAVGGGASLVLSIHDDTGAVIHTSGSLTPDATGKFHHVLSFVPADGRIYTSTATIVDGAATYRSVETIVVAA